MKLPQSGLILDNPAFPLIQAEISYIGRTSANGNAGGTTFVCADLANEPSYVGQSVKMLGGLPAGQLRDLTIHAGATQTVDLAFTDPTGAATQILAGTLFVILSTNYEGVVGAILADLSVPPADAVTNLLERDVIGNKTDTTTQTLAGTNSLMRYIKGIVDMLNTAVGIIAWPARAKAGNGISLSKAIRDIDELKPEWSGVTAVTYTTGSVNEETIFQTTVPVAGFLHMDLTLRNMIAGDDFTFRVYKKADGANFDLMSEQQILGNPTMDIFTMREFFEVTDQIKFTVQRASGTDRAFPYLTRTLHQPVV